MSARFSCLDLLHLVLLPINLRRGHTRVRPAGTWQPPRRGRACAGSTLSILSGTLRRVQHWQSTSTFETAGTIRTGLVQHSVHSWALLAAQHIRSELCSLRLAHSLWRAVPLSVLRQSRRCPTPRSPPFVLYSQLSKDARKGQDTEAHGQGPGGQDLCCDCQPGRWLRRPEGSPGTQHIKLSTL